MVRFRYIAIDANLRFAYVCKLNSNILNEKKNVLLIGCIEFFEVGCKLFAKVNVPQKNGRSARVSCVVEVISVVYSHFSY